MKKYLVYTLLLLSCNQAEKVYTIDSPATDQPLTDSISLIVDSLKEWSENISDISSYAIQAKSEIKKLQQENKELAEKAGEVVPLAMMYSVPSDVKDKQIRDLVTERNFLKSENTRLKNIIYSDSVYKSRMIGKVPEPTAEIRPNENSIILQLDRRMKDDGDIPLESITAYILPYDKKAKKWKEYGYCSGLKGKQAELYNGQFFFNDVPPGKYLIKLCTYSGGYKIIEKETGLQVVAMQVAPPIQ